MKKNLLIGLGIILGIAFLAGAAFLAARLLAPNKSANGPLGGREVSIVNNGGGGNVSSQSSFSLEMEPAKEIPTRSADKTGLVSEIKDNSLTISSVSSVTAVGDSSGEVKIDAETNGSATEVVVTRETQIFLDTTFANHSPEERMPADGEKLQQTVESISFGEIAPNDIVVVWGYKRGDRLVAEVIMCNRPVMFQRGGD